MKFTFSYLDDKGLLRSQQEDCGFIMTSLVQKSFYDNLTPCTLSYENDIILLCVADGMGGASNGALASKICTDAIRQYIMNADFMDIILDIRQFSNQLINHANDKILNRIEEDPSTIGMGTTVIIGLIYKNVLHLSWIGDSRCYIFKNDALNLVSRDHSYVQELIERGIIQMEDEYDHPQKNIITQSLGSVKIIPGYISIDIDSTMFILLCSDGLNTMLRLPEIQNVFLNFKTVSEINDHLLDLVIERGAYDNVTLCLCLAELDGDIQETGSEKVIKDNSDSEIVKTSFVSANIDSNTSAYGDSQISNHLNYENLFKNKSPNGFLLIFGILLLLALVFFFFIHLKKNQNRNNLIKEISETDSKVDTMDLFYLKGKSDTSEFLSDQSIDTVIDKYDNNGVLNPANVSLSKSTALDSVICENTYLIENYKIRYDVYNTKHLADKAMKSLAPKIKSYCLNVEKLESENIYGLYIEKFRIKDDAEKLINEMNMPNAVIVKITK